MRELVRVINSLFPAEGAALLKSALTDSEVTLELVLRTKVEGEEVILGKSDVFPDEANGFLNRYYAVSGTGHTVRSLALGGIDLANLAKLAREATSFKYSVSEGIIAVSYIA